MLIASNTIISRNEDCLSTSNDTETIILNLQTGNYLKLNDTGRIIWNLLENDLAYEDLFEKICSDYDACKDQIEKDLKNFLNECKNKKILNFNDSESL